MDTTLVFWAAILIVGNLLVWGAFIMIGRKNKNG